MHSKADRRTQAKKAELLSVVSFGTKVVVMSSVQVLLEKFRTLVSQASLQGVSLKEAFIHFDENDDGRITRQEFQKGLRSLKLETSSGTFALIVNSLDHDGDSTICYQEFIDLILGSDLSTNDEVKRLRKRIADLENIIGEKSLNDADGAYRRGRRDERLALREKFIGVVLEKIGELEFKDKQLNASKEEAHFALEAHLEEMIARLRKTVHAMKRKLDTQTEVAREYKERDPDSCGLPSAQCQEI